MVDRDVARSWNSGSSQIAGLGITMPTLGKLEKYLSAGTTLGTSARAQMQLSDLAAQTIAKPPLPAARHGVCVTRMGVTTGLCRREAELPQQVPSGMRIQSATPVTRAGALTYAEVEPGPEEGRGDAHAHELRDGVAADLVLVQGPRRSDDRLLRRGVRLCDRLLRRSGVRLPHHLLRGCAHPGSNSAASLGRSNRHAAWPFCNAPVNATGLPPAAWLRAPMQF